MISWYVAGKQLFSATQCYKNGNFQASSESIDDYLRVNPKDFVGNFLKARIEVSQRHFGEGARYLNVCKQLKPDLEEILHPWVQLVEQMNGGDFSIESIHAANEITDAKLEYLHSHREFDIMDIFLVFFITCIIGIITIYKSPVTKILFYFILMIFLIFIYEKRIQLKENFYVRLQKKKELLWSGNFAGTCFMFLIPIVINTNFSPDKSGLHQLSNAQLFLQVTFKPVVEELFNRGIAFQALKKYGVIIAMIAVSVVDMFFTGSIFHALIYLLLTQSYIKFKTILAPVVLHVLWGLIVLITCNTF